MVRKAESFSFHWDTRLTLSTRIRVLTFLLAISFIAATVFPKAVVPQWMKEAEEREKTYDAVVQLQD